MHGPEAPPCGGIGRQGKLQSHLESARGHKVMAITWEAAEILVERA